MTLEKRRNVIIGVPVVVGALVALLLAQRVTPQLAAIIGAIVGWFLFLLGAVSCPKANKPSGLPTAAPARALSAPRRRRLAPRAWMLKGLAPTGRRTRRRKTGPAATAP